MNRLTTHLCDHPTIPELSDPALFTKPPKRALFRGIALRAAG
jgi:hypothetical protein